jgi:hypothetical protein
MKGQPIKNDHGFERLLPKDYLWSWSRYHYLGSSRDRRGCTKIFIFSILASIRHETRIILKGTRENTKGQYTK